MGIDPGRIFSKLLVRTREKLIVKNRICSPLLLNNTYTASVSFLTNDGRGNVPAHGKIFDNRGDVAGLGKNPQNGVALSNVTPFTRCGQDAAKYRATNPPREFPTM